MECYTYKPLTEDGIRLIKFVSDSNPDEVSLDLHHCTLPSVSSNVRYFALSYCWGSLNDTCDINVGDRKLQITRSLRTALDRTHSSDPGLDTDAHFWIDQICIDQSNIEERNQQVHQMWRIFSAAAHVYAWLGNDEASDPMARLYSRKAAARRTERLQNLLPLEHLPSGHNGARYRTDQEIVDSVNSVGSQSILAAGSSRSSYHRVDTELAGHVLTLLDQPYFSRTWIVPEMLQAQKLTFLHGTQSHSSNELKAALDLMFMSGWKINVQKFVEVKHILQLRASRDYQTATKVSDEGNWWYGEGEVSWTTDATHFLNALEMLHETDCSDVRDKIFAALSNPTLAGKAQMANLRPDYLLDSKELLVVVIAFFDKLEHCPGPIPELSRVLSRSLMLGDGTNSTEAYDSDVAKAVLSCTRPWSEGESLFLSSGKEIGHPGRRLKWYLSESRVTLPRGTYFDSHEGHLNIVPRSWGGV